MYGIRVKIFELLELLDIVGFIVCICFMDIVAWAQEAVLSTLVYIAYIGLFGIGICRYCFWVELPVQRRLCPIF